MTIHGATPLMTALAQVSAVPRYNFHALPWSGDPLIRDPTLRSAYARLRANSPPDIDLSYGRDLLDSPFWPRGPLAAAQEQAARAFRADATFFVSMGTTVANLVAVAAAAEFGDTALLDSTAHQSLHFACDLLGLRTTRIPAVEERPDVADLDEAISMLAAAHLAGQPYATVVLGSSTYAGLRVRAERLLRAVRDVSPTTNVVLDDAWAGIHNFHELTRALSPTSVGARLRDAGEFRGAIWVTHSAHKTMCAMRQAAMVHVLGDERVVEATAAAIYRHHTSSPSWPIMASLDLARAHAELEGSACVDRASAMLRRLRAGVAALGLSGDRLELGRAASQWYAPDELRCAFPVPAAAEVRRRLIAGHRVYLPHPVGSELLVNLTIGVGAEAVDALLAGLADTLRDPAPAPADGRDLVLSRQILAARRPLDYLIAYPPGVPMVSPGGDQLDPDRLAAELAGGASIHRVRSGRRESS
ncbi:hypothetical protein [Nocardia sp. MW-W600-9]